MQTPEQISVSSSSKVGQAQDRSGHIVAALEIEMARALRYQRPLSILCCTGGHLDANGPELASNHFAVHERRLRQLAPKILRITDFWGRVGKYGFVVALPETTLPDAEQVILRIVRYSEFVRLFSLDAHGRKFCLGVAQFAENMKKFDDFIGAARDNVLWSNSDQPASADKEALLA